MRSDSLFLSFINPAIVSIAKLLNSFIKKWVRNGARLSSYLLFQYANKANGNTLMRREANQLHKKSAKTQPEFLVHRIQCEVISLWRKSARREIDNVKRTTYNFLKSTREVSHIDVHPWWINWQRCRCGNVYLKRCDDSIEANRSLRISTETSF